MEDRRIDEAEVDYPDAGVKKTIALVESAVEQVAEWMPLESDGRLGIESWDGLFVREIRGRDESGHDRLATLEIRLNNPASLPSFFHAAASWLGVRSVPLDSVIIFVAADIDDWATAFQKEKERHQSLRDLEMPDFAVLKPGAQFSDVSEESWNFAVETAPTVGLSIRQVFAIRLYTTEFYQAFHSALRSPDLEAGENYQAMMPLIAVMDAGLENLPAHVGRTFRGERNDDPKKNANRRGLKETEVFEEPSYLSSSLSENHVLMMRRGFLFRIDGQTGRDVSGISPFPWEKEILFGRGLRQLIERIDESEKRLSVERDIETIEANPGWRYAKPDLQSPT